MEQSKFKTRNLWLFFLIAFAFTWLFWILEALAMRGMLGTSIFVDFLVGPDNPAAWGPLVAAFLLTYLSARKVGVIKLLKRGVDFRFNKIWWLPTLFLMPAITGGALLLAILSGETIPELTWLSNPLTLVVGSYSFIYLLFLGGPLQEEFGWRGYALPRLQARFNALVSSLILGLMWGLWHLPYFFIGEAIIYQHAIFGLIISDILIAILMTWLYNNTGGSILTALIFHTTISFSWVLFPTLETDLGSLYYLILLILASISITIIWGPKRLVREKQIKTTSPNSG
ncbi:MAG: type II CAAX prenyl endopeptidase Rce1 family protein [Candidatus Methanofastidiosia archaeon]